MTAPLSAPVASVVWARLEISAPLLSVGLLPLSSLALSSGCWPDLPRTLGWSPAWSSGLGTLTPMVPNASDATLWAAPGRALAAARPVVRLRAPARPAAAILALAVTVFLRGTGRGEGAERIASTTAPTAAASPSRAPLVGVAAACRRAATSPKRWGASSGSRAPDSSRSTVSGSMTKRSMLSSQSSQPLMALHLLRILRTGPWPGGGPPCAAGHERCRVACPVSRLSGRCRGRRRLGAGPRLLDPGAGGRRCAGVWRHPGRTRELCSRGRRRRRGLRTPRRPWDRSGVAHAVGGGRRDGGGRS